MTSHHTRRESGNHSIHPTLKFDPNDHTPLIQSIIISHHGIRYNSPNLTTHETQPKVTRMILHTTSSNIYSYESSPFSRDFNIERLQHQVEELQQAFINSQNDNKELMSLVLHIFMPWVILFPNWPMIKPEKNIN